jgi:cell fate regulator YaaT (PSP1 superfamily)
MHGVEIGQVVEPPHTIDDAELPAPLKKVARVATAKDIESLAATDQLRKEAMAACRELIRTHGLDMKLVGAEIGFGGEKITFSFFSEERVDFRALVGDLAKSLKMRIELRQVGAREEARMVGGLGPCGRGLCCTLFPGDDDPVSIRMAKEQNLPLNPVKISGLCGRLMCCLKYEQEQYVRFRKEAPAKGTPISTPVGEGVVAGYNVTKDSITIKLEDGSFTDMRLCCCECREDGTLVAVPEEKPPTEIPWLDSPLGIDRSAGVGRASGRRSSGGDAGAEADTTSGDEGEAGEAQGDEGSRRSRSRRQRGRRRGRGRSAGEGNGEATAAAAGTPGGAAGAPPGSGTASSEGRSGAAGDGRSRHRGGRSGRRAEHRAELRREGAGGEHGGEAGGSEGGARRGADRQRPGRPGGGPLPEGGSGTNGAEGHEAGSGGGGRSRRRRRPRRSGGGARGDGSNGRADGGSDGGSAGDTRSGD